MTIIDIGSTYIHAEETVSTNAKPMYCIINNSTDAVLGGILYFWGWHRYAFQPQPNTEFDVSCLECIIKFMRGLK